MSSQQSAIICLNSTKRHFFFAVEDCFLWDRNNSFVYYLEDIQIYAETAFVVIGFDPNLYKA